MIRGVAVDLLQMANRIGTQCESAKYKDLAGEERLPQGGIAVDDWWSHQAFC